MTDLILFAGQSNMAGRGEAELAQLCPAAAGLEYRAVTMPQRLVPIREPFGRCENREGGIDDHEMKSGSLVSAFVNAYSQASGRSVVAVSASQGGTSTAQWLEYLAEDAARRLEDALAFLNSRGAAPAHVLVAWCQGETDGDHAVTKETYIRNFERIWEMLRKAGAQQCGLIQIGHYNYKGYPCAPDGQDGLTVDAQYDVIRKAQAELCERRPDVWMIGSFEPCLSMMKDQFHYHQPAYEQVGRQAGKAFAGLVR